MFTTKKGMEMWQLVIMILVIILLLVVLAWYGVSGDNLEGFFEKFGGLL